VSRCHGGMASQAQAISISDIQEHHAGCADCGADGRFDQEYVVALRWMATLLSHVARANGAKVFLRKQRGTKYELVVKGHEAQALEKTAKDFFTLLGDLHAAIKQTVESFCARVPGLVAEAARRSRIRVWLSFRDDGWVTILRGIVSGTDPGDPHKKRCHCSPAETGTVTVWLRSTRVIENRVCSVEHTEAVGAAIGHRLVLAHTPLVDRGRTPETRSRRWTAALRRPGMPRHTRPRCRSSLRWRRSSEAPRSSARRCRRSDAPRRRRTRLDRERTRRTPARSRMRAGTRRGSRADRPRRTPSTFVPSKGRTTERCRSCRRSSSRRRSRCHRR
jgi:hypothetical protein